MLLNRGTGWSSANFIWSDMSAQGTRLVQSETGTEDWATDFLVKLPTSTQTIEKK